MRNGILYLLMFLLAGPLAPHSEEVWEKHAYSDNISSIVFAGPYLWCTAGNCVIRWNTADSTYTLYDSRNGLSGGEYFTMAADRDGALWIGSADGINRFDGTSCRIFRKEDGLANNMVYQITVLPDNTILARENIGRSRFDGERWTALPSSTPEGWYIYGVCADTDGVIWMGTDHGLLSSGDGDSWVRRLEGDMNLRKITTGPDGRKWFLSSWGKVWVYDGATFSPDETVAGREITTMEIDRDGSHWYGTSGEGVLQVRDGTIRAHTTADGLPSNIIQSSGIDPGGNLWFGTIYGLARYDGNGWKTFCTGVGPMGNSITGLFTDNRNLTWASTTSGLSWFDGKHWQTVGPLAGKFVSAAAGDRTGGAWAAVYGDGVYHIEGDACHRYGTEDGLAGRYIAAIAVDLDNAAWFGTYGYGVSRFDGRTWKTYTIRDGLEDDMVTGITVDGADTKWFAAPFGISRFDGTNWKTFSKRDGLAHNQVNSLVADAEGVLWFATDNGLSRFDGVSWSTRYFWGREGYASVAVDRYDTKWVGNRNGRMGLLVNDSWKRYYSVPSDLGTFPIQHIAFGRDEVRWFGSREGGLISMRETPLTVEDKGVRPLPFAFRGGRPNPFNASTVLEFTLPEKETASLAIYNAAGQKIRELVSGRLEAGPHSVRWDGNGAGGSRVSSGLYIARLRAGNQAAAAKLLFLK